MAVAGSIGTQIGGEVHTSSSAEYFLYRDPVICEHIPIPEQKINNQCQS